MTDTTNPTAKYSKNYSGDVGETPKSMAGTWHLEAPDGRRWAGSCPINCVAQELAERVPVQVQLARMLTIVAESDLDERHAKLGVEYGTGKVDDLVDKLHAEITELRAQLEALEKQEPYAFEGKSGVLFNERIPGIESKELYLAAGARPVEPAPAAVAGPTNKVLWLLMAQYGLNMTVGQDMDNLLNFGRDVWNAALSATQPAPAAQDDAKDAARWRYAVEIGGNQRMNWLDVYDDWDGDGSFADAIDAAMAADIFGDVPQPSQEPPPIKPMCCRCLDESDDLFPANCSEKPELLTGAPLGMYHCPDCGAMVCAGFPHGPLCQTCHDRKHPGFDCDNTSAADKKEPT